MPRFSLITPTYRREAQLIMRYQQLLSQTLKDWEWIILDMSSKPCEYFVHIHDQRVIYHHTSETFSIGEMRNELREKSKGEWIVHCDDDDYFSPDYLSSLVPLLEEVDLLKAHAWFAYDRNNKELFYVDAFEAANSYFHFDPLTETSVRQVFSGKYIEKRQIESLFEKHLKGYGFSFVYRRESTSNLLFESLDIGEDIAFFNHVKANGLIVSTYPEQNGIIVKGLGSDNLSQHYPQFRIPKFALSQILPNFASYLKGEFL